LASTGQNKTIVNINGPTTLARMDIWPKTY